MFCGLNFVGSDMDEWLIEEAGRNGQSAREGPEMPGSQSWSVDWITFGTWQNRHFECSGTFVLSVAACSVEVLCITLYTYTLYTLSITLTNVKCSLYLLSLFRQTKLLI